MPSLPPATTVILVRHGATPSTGKILPGRAAGLHLSDAGHEQASRVAGMLAGWSEQMASRGTNEPPKTARRQPRGGETGSHDRRGSAGIAAVYCSPLERTRETAAPIGAALGLRVRRERGLLECDFGEWTGSTLKDLAKLPEWATVQRYPSGFRFPGGESFTGMQARIVETLGRLRASHPGETIVVVSHADPIKAAVADALGTHLDLFQRIVISPCSVTAIVYGATSPAVLTVNSTRALNELKLS